jgi:hypothetical protein
MNKKIVNGINATAGLTKMSAKILIALRTPPSMINHFRPNRKK